MRKLFLMVVFFVAVSLAANPLEPMLVQQLWFTDADELILQFGYQTAWHNGSEIEIIVDGVNLFYTIPDIPEGEYPFEINLSELMPLISPSRESGNLSMHIWEMVESVSWGDGRDCQVSSLLGSESIYQHMFCFPSYDGYASYKSWAKSPDPLLVENYDCPCRSQLNIHVQNLQGEPLEDIPVFTESSVFAIGHTDYTGTLCLDLYPRNTWIRIFHPEYLDAADYEGNLMLEPNQSYDLYHTMNYTANSDPCLQIRSPQLRIQPSVVLPSQEIFVEIDKGLSKDIKLELYDIKGRFIQSENFSGSDFWTPPRLSKGIYFLRLKADGHSLDTQKFIMLQ